jgi:anti-anti-sigma factor
LPNGISAEAGNCGRFGHGEESMRVLNESGKSTVILPEKFDGTTLANFKRATHDVLAGRGLREVVLDFEAVDYVDSMALGALLLLRERAGAAGKTVVLTGMRAKVRSLFSLANLHRIFDIR